MKNKIEKYFEELDKEVDEFDELTEDKLIAIFKEDHELDKQIEREFEIEDLATKTIDDLRNGENVNINRRIKGFTEEEKLIFFTEMKNYSAFCNMLDCESPMSDMCYVCKYHKKSIMGNVSICTNKDAVAYGFTENDLQIPNWPNNYNPEDLMYCDDFEFDEDSNVKFQFTTNSNMLDII